MSGNAYVVIAWAHPYDGIEIERDARGLRIKVPFMDIVSASVALQKMSTSIEQENPVVQGTVLAGELEQ